MKTGTHYSLAMSPALKNFATGARRMIERNFKGKSVILYFGGFSGAAHGLATYHGFFNRRKKSDVKISAAYIRKPGELSHGIPVERSTRDSNVDACIFIDEFISLGETLERCTRALTRVDSDYARAKFFAIIGSDYSGPNAYIELHSFEIYREGRSREYSYDVLNGDEWTVANFTGLSHARCPCGETESRIDRTKITL